MLHHVYANRSNAGDWLSALGIQQLLGGEVVEHLCDEPFVPETLDALSHLRQGDAVVVGGGGLFMDYFDPFWKGLVDVLPPEVPFVIWGAGYVDLKDEPSRPSQSIVEEVARRAAGCFVRDELTRSILGVPLPPASPCPSLVAVAPAPEGWGVCHSDNLTTVGESAYEEMDRQSRAFAEQTGRPFRRTNNLLLAGSRAGLDEVLERYAASDLVVSSRLHGCIFAVAMGKPLIAVSGDWKVESFMAAAGLAEWCLAQDELDRLTPLMQGAAGQPSCAEFVEAARASSAAIAESVREIVGR